MIEVTYKGKDIADTIEIIRCYHDMYAEKQVDTLHITFDDSGHVWDGWKPKPDDKIEITYGAIRTGTMYVHAATPLNGLFEIVATSAPASRKDKKSKAWRKVKLKAMGKEIADNHGLGFEAYGVTDVLFDHLMQINENDFAFFEKRCILEGCAFLIYDSKLILYSEKYMENLKPEETVYLTQDSDYKYNDNSGKTYGTCRIEQGEYVGEYKSGNASKKIYVPDFDITISSKADADRYARNMLRHANKEIYNGHFFSQIMTGYAPASMAKLENERAPSWDGDVFLTHVRNDYATGKSKIFFRRPLEGD